MRPERPLFGIRLVGPRSAVIPGLVALTFVSSPSLLAQSSPADGPWTGSITCRLDVDTGTYKRHETQTWTITGPPLSTTGSVRVYPATWSATGEGSLHRSQGPQLVNVQWKVDVPPTSAQLAMFVRTADNKLIISQQSSRMRVARGITGTRTVSANGKQQPSSPINAVAEEWTLGYLANDAPFTSLTGSTSIDAEPLSADLNLPGTPKTATCTWQFSLNTTPAAGDQRVAPPQLLAITPGAVDQGATSVPITLSGRNTHWQAGNTTADFGAGINVVSLTIESPVSATAVLNVAQDAGPGTRPVMITTTGGTRPETVGLPDKFSVNPVLIAIVSPAVLPSVALLTGVAPVSAAPGANAFQVSLTGSGTHFAAGTSKADFGAGITVASLTVTSPTAATAVLNIARNAAVGPRTVSVTTGTEVAKRVEAFSLVLPPAPPIGVAPPTYRIILNAVRVNWQTYDDVLNLDGQGDEIYAAVSLLEVLRDGSVKRGPEFVKTAVHGDINGRTDRVRAGSGFPLVGPPTGGLLNGDVIPAGQDPTKPTAPLSRATDAKPTFPLIVWEGKLDKGGPAVIVRPTLWEWDGSDVVYLAWENRLRKVGNESVFDGTSPEIRITPAQITAANLSPAKGVFAMLHYSTAPYAFLTGKILRDRPIGLQPGRGAGDTIGGPEWRDLAYVFTYEAIEKAFAAQNSPPQGPASLVFAVPLVDDQNPEWHGNYDLFLRVDRVQEVTAEAAPVYVATTDPNASPKKPIAGERQGSIGANLLPAIIDVSPNSGEQWNDNQVITFTTQNTNFVRGTTKVDLGPGITLVDPPLFITMATRGIGTFKIAGDAAPGPRTITITTGTEVATLPGGFTVTPRDVREVFLVAPNTGTIGQRGLSVSITRPWRYFYTGTTLDFGPDIEVSGQTVTDFKMTAVLNISPIATAGPRAVTVKIPTRNPETFPGVFTVEPHPKPTLAAVTPNSANAGASNVTVSLTGTNFMVLTADFGAGISVTRLVWHSPTSATVTLNIAGSAALGPRPVKLTSTGVNHSSPQVVTLANGFTVLPALPAPASEPQADQYEPNDRREDAKLILSGMASCYTGYRGAPSSLVGGVTLPPPPTVTISANFHSASDTSDWFRVSAIDGPPIQFSGQPIKYMDLKIAASISDGPSDGIYRIAISEGTSVLITSPNGHAPSVSYQWNHTVSSLGIPLSWKTFNIEVRHVSGAPSNQFYKLHIKLGD